LQSIQSYCAWRKVSGSLYVGNHGDLNLTRESEGQGHAKRAVDLATGNLHCTGAIIKESFLGALQPIRHFGHDSWLGMADFQIGNMPNTLLVFDILLGNLRIIGMDFRTNRHKVFDKILIVEKSSFHNSIKSIQKTDI
jgi:hypothetical protein